MSRVKIKLQDNLARMITIETAATIGATIGTDLKLPDGTVATIAQLQTLFGSSSSGGVTRHRLLQGLTLGNDHPQYPRKAAAETIAGQWQWSTSLWGPNGTAAAPAFTFTSDLDTGFYRIGADNLGLSVGGVLRLDVSATAVTSALPWLGQNGSAGAPSLSFSGDADTGIYRVGANDLGFATNGVLRLDISATAFTGALPWLGQNGTAAAPAVSFSGDSDTGLFSQAANALGLAANGAEVARFDVSATATHTRFLIYDVDTGNLSRVTVGAADSGGAGFKLLRVPN